MTFSTTIPSLGMQTDESIQIAFIREGNLWIYSENKEQKIVDDDHAISSPKWSPDGKWIMYQTRLEKDKEIIHEIWAYHVNRKEKKKIPINGHTAKWAPNQNIIAFLNEEVLNVSDLNIFQNVSIGVNDFTWLPNGNGFLLASQANRQPNGWTNLILFKKNWNPHETDTETEHFFTIPKEVGTDKERILAIQASQFQFSPSDKWISFVVSPTASWSMDSNMLCIISSKGKEFSVLDEVILGVGKPKWAPTEDTIAYIAGGGRIVFGFKDKDLKIKEVPTTQPLTPDKYAELDFTWIDHNLLVTSRVKEAEWSNDFRKHPLPSLYKINRKTNEQFLLTKPPKGKGDYEPTYINAINKLIWFRGNSIIDAHKDVWIGDIDGTNLEMLLKNVKELTVYENK